MRARGFVTCQGGDLTKRELDGVHSPVTLLWVLGEGTCVTAAALPTPLQLHAGPPESPLRDTLRSYGGSSPIFFCLLRVGCPCTISQLQACSLAAFANLVSPWAFPSSALIADLEALVRLIRFLSGGSLAL